MILTFGNSPKKKITNKYQNLPGFLGLSLKGFVLWVGGSVSG
jgi:hypothetical protein